MSILHLIVRILLLKVYLFFNNLKFNIIYTLEILVKSSIIKAKGDELSMKKRKIVVIIALVIALVIIALIIYQVKNNQNKSNIEYVNEFVDEIKNANESELKKIIEQSNLMAED